MVMDSESPFGTTAKTKTPQTQHAPKSGISLPWGFLNRCGLSFPSGVGHWELLGNEQDTEPNASLTKQPSSWWECSGSDIPHLRNHSNFLGQGAGRAFIKNHLYSSPPLDYSPHKPRSDHSLQRKTSQNSQSRAASNHQFIPQSQI